MSATVRIDTTLEITLDIGTAAKWFAGLDDDQQCQFLVAVATIAETWPSGADGQWYALGGHLRNCKCSTEAARDMVKAWAHYAETSTHGRAPASPPAQDREGVI